eukprot:7371795-Karenia_brevis.AAC.1
MHKCEHMLIFHGKCVAENLFSLQSALLVTAYGVTAALTACVTHSGWSQDPSSDGQLVSDVARAATL